MTTPGTVAGLSRHDIETILDVTRALAAPFDLLTMLATVTRGRGRTPKLQADVSEADANELVTWLKLKFGPVE